MLWRCLRTSVLFTITIIVLVFVSPVEAQVVGASRCSAGIHQEGFVKLRQGQAQLRDGITLSRTLFSA
jgi:hypothetical protein